MNWSQTPGNAGLSTLSVGQSHQHSDLPPVVMPHWGSLSRYFLLFSSEWKETSLCSPDVAIYDQILTYIIPHTLEAEAGE